MLTSSNAGKMHAAGHMGQNKMTQINQRVRKGLSSVFVLPLFPSAPAAGVPVLDGDLLLSSH